VSEPLAGFELVLTNKRQSIANIELQEKDPVRNGGVLFYLNSRFKPKSLKLIILRVSHTGRLMTNPHTQAHGFSAPKKLFALILAPILPWVIGISIAQSSQAASPQQTAITQASWFSNVKVSFSGDSVIIASDGLPNWKAEKYAVPNAGVVVPESSNDVTLGLASKLVTAQKLNYTITLNPTKAASVTSTSLGPIGILANGAVIFNPYEGDGKTVAVTGNVYVTDSNGVKWGFLDVCNGHPGMGGMYHYHGMPPCVTSVIDKTGGPSHILGLAFDGFLIYGNRDINGKLVSSSQLDQCNGITSPTPEYPAGIYHYVLTEEKSNRSTINCFAGTPALSQGGGMQPGGMGGMPGMGGPPPGGQQPGGPQPAAQASATPTPSATPSPSATPVVKSSATPSPTPSYTTLYKAVKATQLVCQKGATKKSVIANVCPTGYKKVSSKTITTFVETQVLINP
jgi:hypothetical protein